MDIPEEAALVEAIRLADESAACVFCDRFRPRLSLLIRTTRIPAADAEAVLQDILATALDQIKRGRFRGEALLGTWLHAIARGKIADYWRRSAGAKRLVPLDGVPAETASTVIEYRPEDVIAVQEALERLAPEDRLVLWLHDAEGATLEEIGRRIGRKKSAVAERLAHARQRFRAAFCDDAGNNRPILRLKE